jgi:predicted nucleotidyltransferase
MRLSTEYVTVIRNTVRALDPDAQIYLFGSRTDDAKRGGDIDLLVLSKKLGSDSELDIIRTLHDRLGEQKIDIIIAADKKRPFVRVALESARQL